MFWRCHNKEFYLKNNSNKDLYMICVKEGLKKEISQDNIKIYAFCVMSNHYHQLTSYKNGSYHLSNYMRHSHSLFGSRYNKTQNRSGKVAESRPKTSLIEDNNHDMRVHFYIETNPIRAGMYKIENLHTYKYSSFGFYAYGKRSWLTDLLTIPDWYLELGKNPKQRQSKYRKLFYEYLREESKSGLKESRDLYQMCFIGSILWMSAQRDRVRAQKKKLRSSIQEKSSSDHFKGILNNTS